MASSAGPAEASQASQHSAADTTPWAFFRSSYIKTRNAWRAFLPVNLRLPVASNLTLLLDLIYFESSTHTGTRKDRFAYTGNNRDA